MIGHEGHALTERAREDENHKFDRKMFSLIDVEDNKSAFSFENRMCSLNEAHGKAVWKSFARSTFAESN